MTLSGNPFDYVLAFFGGVLISLTPCIYPLIPVTVGFIGATSGGSRQKGFFLSLVYVTGMSLTYSALGLIAALTGSIFGSISAHPLTDLIAGIIILIFGILMLDVFNLPTLQFIKLPKTEKGSYISAFLLGLTSGLVIGPCLTPVLGSILLHAGRRQDMLYGATLLLAFAYGMGLILILIGTFSSILVNLPKSGRWLIVMKKICAFILMGVGLYFIYLAIRRF